MYLNRFFNKLFYKVPFPLLCLSSNLLLTFFLLFLKITTRGLCHRFRTESYVPATNSFFLKRHSSYLWTTQNDCFSFHCFLQVSFACCTTFQKLHCRKKERRWSCRTEVQSNDCVKFVVLSVRFSLLCPLYLPMCGSLAIKFIYSFARCWGFYKVIVRVLCFM